MCISIHALLAESDAIIARSNMTAQDFYPRSPCGERQTDAKREPKGRKFLSTLSLRRATAGGQSTAPAPAISIHALLAESDGVAHI